jgi:hypothetical protein
MKTFWTLWQIKYRLTFDFTTLINELFLCKTDVTYTAISFVKKLLCVCMSSQFVDIKCWVTL